MRVGAPRLRGDSVQQPELAVKAEGSRPAARSKPQRLGGTGRRLGGCGWAVCLLAVAVASLLPKVRAFPRVRALGRLASECWTRNPFGGGEAGIKRRPSSVGLSFVLRSEADMGNGASSQPNTPRNPASAPGPAPRVYKRSTLEGIAGYLNILPGDRRLVLNGPTGTSASIVQDESSKGTKAAEELRKQITAIYGQFVNEEGTGVDYDAVRTSEQFAAYCLTAEKLEAVDVGQLSRDEKLAFFINIYNSLVIHAIISLGTPADLLSRLRLYAVASYNIGGQIYSLNEIENGILRGNRKPPSFNSRFPFAASDVRQKFVMDQPDARIHFALNCGAKGCPPIRFYKAESIDDMLQKATKAYLKSTELDEDKGELQISKLFAWYSQDFLSPGGKSKDEQLMDWVVPYLDDERKEKIYKMRVDKNLKVTYQPYDWGLNKK